MERFAENIIPTKRLEAGRPGRGSRFPEPQ
jgi:hypothetical protein